MILNTTAVALGLGTGGYDFVIWVEGRGYFGEVYTPGHTIKARYTPFQVRCLAAEEEDSRYHDILQEFSSLMGVPVIACELHSMLAPVVAGIKEAAGDEVRVAYVMTDGGALPLAFSNLIRALCDRALIDTVITCGHAGGNFEV